MEFKFLRAKIKQKGLFGCPGLYLFTTKLEINRHHTVVSVKIDQFKDVKDNRLTKPKQE